MTANNPQASIGDEYRDKETCCEMIRKCRDIFCDRNTTQSMYELMCLGLARMVLYCNDDMRSLAHATLLEAKMREIYFYKIWNTRKKV